MHLLSRLQANRHAETVEFMDHFGLRYQPADIKIRREDLVAALGNLRRYRDNKRPIPPA